jgi:hypothetical protein
LMMRPSAGNEAVFTSGLTRTELGEMGRSRPQRQTPVLHKRREHRKSCAARDLNTRTRLACCWFNLSLTWCGDGSCLC